MQFINTYKVIEHYKVIRISLETCNDFHVFKCHVRDIFFHDFNIVITRFQVTLEKIVISCNSSDNSFGMRIKKQLRIVIQFSAL